jgi:hypothetical protein
MTTDTGGPAFPCHPGIENPIYDGMTLRDYFAAKAMEGLLSAGRDAQYGNGGMGDLAKSSYSIADAMLKARKA